MDGVCPYGTPIGLVPWSLYEKIQCKVLNREEATLNIGRICLVYTIAAPPVWKCKTKTKMSYKCDMSLSFTFQLNSTFPKLLVQNKIDLWNCCFLFIQQDLTAIRLTSRIKHIRIKGHQWRKISLPERGHHLHAVSYSTGSEGSRMSPGPIW